MKRFETYLKPDILIYIILFAGFLGGMLCSFILKGEESTQLIWLDSVLMYLKYGEVQYGDMLFFVLQKRLSSIALLFVLCMSGKGKFIMSGLLFPIGGLCGYFITEFIMAKGLMGILLFICCIFPHYLCYAYGYYRLLVYLIGVRNVKQQINRAGQNKAGEIMNGEIKYIKKLVPFAVVIIGMLLECYVNPIFIKLFLKIFM